MITPVLLCGGSGTRLWPLSRKSYPKQFSPLIGEESLFQASAKRFGTDEFTDPIIVTANDFRFIVTEQLSAIDVTASDILIEPEGRDTAPAILAAALSVFAKNPDSLMLIAPSDHVIATDGSFEKCVNAAIPAAQSGNLVTFGISPNRPETGYGYLELEHHPGESLDAVPLKSFVEKPDKAEASRMLAEGRYLWNAGIFLFSARAIVDAFRTHAPDLVTAVQSSVDNAKSDLGFTRLDPASWKKAKPISIDYAVMEKAQNLSVVPFSGKWSDLGDWSAVWRETETESVAEKGDAISLDCKNSLLRSEVDGQAIVGIGLENIVAVAMPDAVLISHKDRSQDVKTAVAKLKEKQLPQAESFPKDHRPWGWFESLVVGERFQVKRIVVHPGAALSLQSHHHRAEHWIVVKGIAKVTVDDDVKLVSENQSVYIPLGAVHRMENPGKVEMVLIEVQTGSYLGEDDIVRYEDIYARD